MWSKEGPRKVSNRSCGMTKRLRLLADIRLLRDWLESKDSQATCSISATNAAQSFPPVEPPVAFMLCAVAWSGDRLQLITTIGTDHQSPLGQIRA